MSLSKPHLVIDARSQALRIYFVHCEGGVVSCVRYEKVSATDPQSDRNILLDQNALDAAKSIIEADGRRLSGITFLIGGAASACHYFSIPGLAGKELVNAVRLKLGQQMHFSLDEAVVDIEPLQSEKAGGDKRIRAAAVEADVSEAAVEFARQLGFERSSVTVSSLALQSLADKTVKETTGPEAVLFIDHSASTLMVPSPKGPLLTTELPIGQRDFVAALMRPIISGEDMIQLDEGEATAAWQRYGIPAAETELESVGVAGKNVLPLLEPALQRFAQQLVQWLTFVTTSESSGKVESIVLVGPGASVFGFDRALKRRLEIEVTVKPWLESIAIPGGKAKENLPLEFFAGACGAVLHDKSLPNLISDGEKKRRRIKRIRCSTTRVGPFVAAAALGFAFMINQLVGGLNTAAGDVQNDISRMREVDARNQRIRSQADAVQVMKTEIETFSKATPNWLGLMKELTYILPEGVSIERLTGREVEQGIRVGIEAVVKDQGDAGTCDQLIEKTLTALEHSPFSDAVHLINISRADPASGKRTARLNVEIDVVYQHPVKKEKN